MANKKVVDKASAALVPQEVIENKIFLIRDKKVMLDKDLAVLYDVTTGNLNKAVKRNLARFPEDFMFQLTKEEAVRLRFQIGSLKRGQHIKYLPYVFTEQGVAMLSGVLTSIRAVEVNVAIMRVFVKLREIVSSNQRIMQRLNELERKMETKDEEVQAIFQAIRDLMEPQPAKRKPKIGFHQ
jgi:ORF6N domain